MQAWLRGAATSVCAPLLWGPVRSEQVAERPTALGIRACVTLTPKARDNQQIRVPYLCPPVGRLTFVVSTEKVRGAHPMNSASRRRGVINFGARSHKTLWSSSTKLGCGCGHFGHDRHKTESKPRHRLSSGAHGLTPERRPASAPKYKRTI